MKLTDKQVEALRALSKPGSPVYERYWLWAGSHWQSARRTLGSLHHRGLVSYDSSREHYWLLTEAGKEAVDATRDRTPAA